MVLAGAFGSLFTARAQDVALKTNLLYDAFENINLGIEFGMAPRWTMDISGEVNLWTLSHDRKWKHWFVQPEARYWFCDRFSGHFIGIHAIGGQYNVGNINPGFKLFGTDFRNLAHNRYQGWAVGGGVAYGYGFILGKHWNLELEVGIGYVYTEYDKFECLDCGQKIANNVPHNYWGPTKAAINIVYVF